MCYKDAGDRHCTQSTQQDTHHSRQTATAEEPGAAGWAVRWGCGPALCGCLVTQTWSRVWAFGLIFHSRFTCPSHLARTSTGALLRIQEITFSSR